MDFTIVIPHRGNGLGLWATIHSCEEELSTSKFEYNYVIVTNGEELSLDTRQVLFYLEKSGRLLKHTHFDEALTPPVARQRGARIADGNRIFFFDNHCLVGKDYFVRAMYDMDSRGIEMLHSATVFYGAQGRHYHYNLTLENNFWGRSTLIPERECLPYQMAAGGHGGFCIDRATFLEVGGYGPDELFSGYGGEELIFDLKMWRYGKTNWMDPKVVHYHYCGVRGYDRHYTDDYYRNLLASANVIGGEKWMYTVFDSFVSKGHLRLRPEKPWYELLQDAYYRTAQYAAEVNAKSKFTLDECLKKFQWDSVAM